MSNEDLKEVKDDQEATEVVTSTVLNDDGSVTLPLDHPVTYTLKQNGSQNEIKVEKLTFRRIKGDDLIAIENVKSEIKTVQTLFMRLAGISSVVFEKLDADDIEAGGEVITNFTKKSRKTGEST